MTIYLQLSGAANSIKLIDEITLPEIWVRETRLSPRQILSKTIFRMPEKLNCSIKNKTFCLTFECGLELQVSYDLHVNFMSTLIRTSTENASILLRIANL